MNGDYETRDLRPARRGILATILMGLGLVAGYGLGAVHFFQYLVPLRRGDNRREMFIGTLKSFPVGESVTVKDLRGQEIAVTRIPDTGGNPEDSFKALSSTCPHLGCKVHWSSSDQQFICPCHMGIFDKDGIAVSGPPAKENKNLATYQVKVSPDNGWVYVMVSGSDDHAA